MSRSARFLTAVLLGLVLVACVASGAQARSFSVSELFAGTWLNETPWALSNEVDVLNCRGIGKPKRDAAYQKTYSSFRCEVHADADNATLGRPDSERQGTAPQRRRAAAARTLGLGKAP